MVAGIAFAIGILLLKVFWVSLVDCAVRLPSRVGLLVGIGMMLMAAGVALRCLSIHTLGPYFLNEVSILPGQPLVTHGLYGVVRHPRNWERYPWQLEVQWYWVAWLG